MKTVCLVVHGETWDVPWGFKDQYRQLLKIQFKALSKGHPGEVIGRLQNIMGLIGFAPTPNAIAEWPLRKRIEAEAYARNVHLRASDNPIIRHPPLPWLPEPWKGPPQGEASYAGPGPTPITE